MLYCERIIEIEVRVWANPYGVSGGWPMEVRGTDIAEVKSLGRKTKVGL